MKNSFPGRWLWLVPLAIAFGGVQVSAEIVNYLPSVADTTLRENQPNDNFGAAGSLPVGVGGSGYPRNRALFRFDLSRVPADAVFNNVLLRFTVTQAGPTSPPTVFELRRVLTNWNEGTQPGLTAGFGEATWVARSNQEFAWTVGGGSLGTDYSAQVTDTGVLGVAGSTTSFGAAGVKADVYAWKTNAGLNFGWVLLAQGEPAGSGKQVGARENPIAGPVLELRYSSYSIYDYFVSGSTIRFSFDVSSNQTYAVEFRDSAATGAWTVLTNIPALAADSTIHFTNQIPFTPRFYRLRKP